MEAYYNEHCPYPAQWLRNLMAADLITKGTVDERDIQQVEPDDLAGFTRCHFFAGIAGWDYALQLAGWPADRPVWTASLPCQPFSAAGKQKGGDDDRHLWPVFYRLVRECRPATIFGEQVEAAIRHGWLDRVFADLEAEGYACGAMGIPAAGVGAPHIRSRIFWGASHRYSKRLPVRHEPRRAGTPQTPPSWSEFKRVHAAGAWAQREAQSAVPVFMDGIPCYVGRIRAYGNAIVPQVAAEFVAAFMEATCTTA